MLKQWNFKNAQIHENAKIDNDRSTDTTLSQIQTLQPVSQLVHTYTFSISIYPPTNKL